MCIYTLQLAAQEKKKKKKKKITLIYFARACHLFVSIHIDGLNV